jgi:hypothetical protein
MNGVILEFIGGAWDGMNLSTETADLVEARLARNAYKATQEGLKGRIVIMPWQYGVCRSSDQGCRYVVTDRTEIDGEILVRLEQFGDRYSAPLVLCSDTTSTGRRIVLRFQGGALNGRTLDSASPDISEALLAAGIYWIAEEGTLGATFNALASLGYWGHPSPGTTRSAFRADYQYRVIDRRDETDRICITLGHSPTSEDQFA